MPFTISQKQNRTEQNMKVCEGICKALKGLYKPLQMTAQVDCLNHTVAAVVVVVLVVVVEVKVYYYIYLSLICVYDFE